MKISREKRLEELEDKLIECHERHDEIIETGQQLKRDTEEMLGPNDESSKKLIKLKRQKKHMRNKILRVKTQIEGIKKALNIEDKNGNSSDESSFG